MLVPLIVVSPPPRCADRMSTPGATRSAPVFEKRATRGVSPLRPTAPTLMTCSDAAGGITSIVNSGRCDSLPVAAISSTSRLSMELARLSNRPTVSRYCLSACEVAAARGMRRSTCCLCTIRGKSIPSDIEMVLAPSAAAQSIASTSMRLVFSPLPITLPTIRRSMSGAMPMRARPPAAPPAMMPAQ